MRASVLIRCTICSEPARQILTFTPYFSSKTSLTAPTSWVVRDV
jgi:hypothetical protein